METKKSQQTLSSHQMDIIRMIAVGGYTLKSQTGFGVSFWVTKKLPGDRLHSVNILRSTFDSLIAFRLIIPTKQVKRYRHTHYGITKSAIRLLNEKEKRFLKVTDLIKKAEASAARQYYREKLHGIGKVRVRYTFWKQVARDYRNELTDLKNQLSLND